MCHKATQRLLAAAAWGLALAPAGWAQAPGVRADWRRLGNSTIELALPGPASGPVERVWHSADGARLYVRTATGRVFETADFEKWQPARATPPPESGDGAVRSSAADPLRRYRFGDQLHRSDDGGLTWAEQTAHRGKSVLGAPMVDLTVSPGDPDEVVAANQFGVWRSLDGGVSWSGLNDGLPNLPVRRLAALPDGPQGVRALTQAGSAIEWAPGEKHAWRPVEAPELEQAAAGRRALSSLLEAEITEWSAAGEAVYAGAADGRLWVSLDRGQTWRLTRAADGAAVEGLFAHAGHPRLALAVLARTTGPRVLRTVNGGLFWDDLTSDLPASAAHAVAADPGSGAVYVATDRGVYFTRVDLVAAGPAASWTRIAGSLPSAPVLDVRLDAEGNLLFAVVEGHGVYSTLAPHRAESLRVVNAADFSQRPAAPGSLLSVLGGRVRAARAGELSFPVLAASETESQIQVPFEVRDRLISLALEAGPRQVVVGVALRDVSPAIFVDRDGTPLLIDGETGVLLDAMHPAYSNSRVQILATGLGRVHPEWPAGVAAPVENPPQVRAQVSAFLDGEPLEVTRAVLAPGYVGLYLIEVRLPALLNRGPAELLIQAEGQPSNRVRIYLEP